MSGEWTKYKPLIKDEDKQAWEAWNKAMFGFVGIEYQPVAYAEQVVAGMNYSFFCNTSPVGPAGSVGSAMVSFYLPLHDGEAQNIRIVHVNSI